MSFSAYFAMVYVAVDDKKSGIKLEEDRVVLTLSCEPRWWFYLIIVATGLIVFMAPLVVVVVCYCYIIRHPPPYWDGYYL